MAVNVLNFENYLKNTMEVIIKKMQFLFLVQILFILLFLFQLDITGNMYYSVASETSRTSGKNTTSKFDPSKSKIYPVSIIRQLSQLSASKQEAIKPLSELSEKMTQLIDEMILSWEVGNFEIVEKRLEIIGESLFELDALRKSLPVFTSFTSDKKAVPATNSNATNQSNTNQSNGAQSDNLGELYIPDVIAVEELQYGLERRYIFWKLALAIETSSEKFPLSANFDKSESDLDKLIELTLAAEKFLTNNKLTTSKGEKIGELWNSYFETNKLVESVKEYKQLLQDGKNNTSVKRRKILAEKLAEFCSTINVILYRFTDSRLTPKQVLYLNSAAISDWRLELARWQSDVVLPVELLCDIERYEFSGGMSNMQDLFRSATRMAFSRSDVSREFGLIAHEVYGGSNVKLYLSKVLVNHLVPSPEREIKSFREYIQNQRVVGKRETDFDVRVNFIPDAERLLLSVDVEGSIATTSRANAFATTLFNRGEAKCTGQKQIEFTEEGFQFSPAEVKVASNRLQLRGIRTEFDGLPLISNLVRAIVYNQYELRRGDARRETELKIRRQVQRQLDREAESGFLGFNDKFSEFMTTSNNDFGLFIERKGSITEEHWLLTSWAIRSVDILGGNTPAPATLRGSFADLKVHESALNAIISKIDIAGKTDTVGNFRAMLGERFKSESIAEAGENDDVVIGFDKYNPVIIRFVDGAVELEISIDLLQLERQTYRDFRVFIRYEPVYVEGGGLMLKRRGVISLEKAKISSQIVLRAVFGKIFPEEKTFSLTPKFLKNDKRFEGLTTGFCRIGKGWFAVALVNSDATTNPPLVSENVPKNQFKR